MPEERLEALEDPEAILTQVRSWIGRAGDALLGFCDSESGIIFGNSLQRAQTSGMTLGFWQSQYVSPTATSRTFGCFYELLRFAVEQRDRATASLCREVLRSVASKLFESILSKGRKPRESRTTGMNNLTDAHILMAAAMIRHVEIRGDDGNLAHAIDPSSLEPVVRQTDGVFSDLLARLTESREFGLALLPSSHTLPRSGLAALDQPESDSEAFSASRLANNHHDFVTYHAIRAIEAFDPAALVQVQKFAPSIRHRLRADILRSLGYLHANLRSEADIPQLTFSVALYLRFSGLSDRLFSQALDCVLRAQLDDGSWPNATVIAPITGGFHHVPSFEIALCLVNLAITLLNMRDSDTAATILARLVRFFDFIRSTYGEGGDGASERGWANDHARRVGVNESWATGVVLVFLIRFHDALEALRQQQTLAKYEVQQTAALTGAWPDMTPLLSGRGHVKLPTIKEYWDPTEDHAFTTGLTDAIQPMLGDWCGRPPPVRSMFFYGPPGSGKTTIAQTIAQAVGWPLLTLSPPAFLDDGGIDGFETAAQRVFRDLNHLKRVVVLFDECDEFFKKRPPRSTTPESRTSGAFITAGMLPRLQRLHDDRWVIFVVATNGKLSNFDTAVRREGRFDVVKEIPMPCLAALREHLDLKGNEWGLEAGELEAVGDALRALADADRPPPLSYKTFKDLVMWYCGEAAFPSGAALVRMARFLSNRSERGFPRTPIDEVLRETQATRSDGHV